MVRHSRAAVVFRPRVARTTRAHRHSRPDPPPGRARPRQNSPRRTEWRTVRPELLVGERGPFARSGQVNQGYLFPLSTAFAEQLAGRFPQVQAAFDEADGAPRRAHLWCIYAPRGAAANLDIGRKAGVWGVRKPDRLRDL